MSLCDRCYDPGACCRKMHLSGGPYAIVVRFADVVDGRGTRPQAAAYAKAGGCPTFYPTVADLGPDGRWFWRFACTALRPNGRCGIYKDRPETCRSYQAGDDDLCVHSHGTEAGDPSAFDHPNYWKKPLLESPVAPYPEPIDETKVLEE